MRQFSIKDMERFSEVKSHTIRTWEKRYGLFTPARSLSNIRNYTSNDLRLLLDISLLLQYGHRISSLVALSQKELNAKIGLLKFDEARKRNVIHALIHCMFSNDIEQFEAVLETSMLAWGLDKTIHDIILPFLEKTQVLSYRDSGIEVHFVVTAIRKKLILAIERTNPPANDARTALLFLPKGEHYDLLLLYMSYVLKEKGLRVLYLGTNISQENLQSIAIEKAPDYLYTQKVSKGNFPLDDYIRMMQKHLPGAMLMVAYTEEAPICKPESSLVHFFKFDMVGKAQDSVSACSEPIC